MSNAVRGMTGQGGREFIFELVSLPPPHPPTLFSSFFY